MKYALTLLLGLFAFCPKVFASEPATIEPWDRVVCIQSKVEGKPDTGKLCSAFLVSDDECLFLVTAGHASAETNKSSRLRYRDPNGETQWVTLQSLFPPASNPWHRDPTSDFAIAQLVFVEGAKEYLSHLSKLAISVNSICDNTPSRTTGIVTVGFPLAIGAADSISPVAVVGHIASRETNASNSWGHEPIVYCTPALAQGTSGGPSFLHASENDAMTVVGMYIGVVNDSTGAKLSKMVPARLIRAAIKNMSTQQDDN